MKIRPENPWIIMLGFALCAASSTGVSRQMPDGTGYHRQAKHNIELRIGLLGSLNSENSVSIGSVAVSNESHGMTGGIGYAYWMEDHLAVTLSADALHSEAGVSTDILKTSTETSTVACLLFGLKVQPFTLTSSQRLRIFLSASAGPIFGFWSGTEASLHFSTRVTSQTIPGARFLTGLEFFPARFLALGLEGGYLISGEFDRPVGSEYDISGPVFSFVLGFLF